MSEVENRKELLAQLHELGFSRTRSDRLSFHHIEVSLLSYDGRVRATCGNEKEQLYSARVKTETILKKIKEWVDAINKEISAFSELCADVELKLFELGVYTEQESARTARARGRCRPKRKMFASPWSAAFHLKANGDRLFYMHAEDDTIELEYLNECVQVKTASDVLKVLLETQSAKQATGVFHKKSISTFGHYKTFLPFIFKYGVTTIKKVKCEVVQTTSDPVAQQLVAGETVIREYIKINLRNKPSLDDQAAINLMGRAE